MDNSPLLTLESTEAGWRMALSGDWRLTSLRSADAALAGLGRFKTAQLLLDGSALEALDSAGAMLLIERLQSHGITWKNVQRSGFDARHETLLALIAARLAGEAPALTKPLPWLEQLGRFAEGKLKGLRAVLAFIGEAGAALGEILLKPNRLRPRELFAQLEVVGLEAVGIVAMMTFLIGVVFAYLLGIQIEKYGANVFIVDGVAMAIARELSPMLTAILVAGRSGAAFTAQIGAMKVTEEIDAIATLGLSPQHVLVIPRLIAILIALPLLTFIGDVVGLLGAAVIAAQQLDITFFTFFTRLKDVLPLDSVLYGLYKAPAFAAAIALIACRNGFAVSRDARSVGERTTTTVVQSLVAVILINAAFAIASPELRA